jgi:DNA invertase Pin-like site-specific DNA recombinase
MKAAIYCRVSTDEQTTDNQMPDIERFAISRGYSISEAYTENESAWKNGHQKELARLLLELESGKHYDAVIVWSLDRLTREGISHLMFLYNRFSHYGCKLLSVKESWTEMPNEFTPIFLAMIGFFAKWESDRRSERVRAGLSRARTQGKGKRGIDIKKRHRSTKLEMILKHPVFSTNKRTPK